MEKILNQEEIDALIRRAAGGVAREPLVEPLRFSALGNVTSEQMHMIGRLHDAFARNTSSNLAAQFSVPISATLVSAEQLRFSEFLPRLSEHGYTGLLKLNPGDRLGMAQMDFPIAAALIDVSLGGSAAAMSPREMTEIEHSLLSAPMRIIARDLSEAWAEIGLSFEFDSALPASRVPQLLQTAERVLALSFDVAIDQIKGTFAFVIPATVSEERLRGMFAKTPRSVPSAEFTRTLRHRLRGAKVGAELVLPYTPVPVRQLRMLEVGSVLKTRVSAEVTPELKVSKAIICRANAVRRGTVRAAQVSTWIEASGD